MDGAHLFSGDERRRYPRYGFQADVDIEFEGKAFRAFLTDISADGMFVVAANPLWVGAEFVARLHIADPLRIKRRPESWLEHPESPTTLDLARRQ